MNIDLQKVEQASHILLITDNSSFLNASVLYTYLLTLHKKVSLQTKEELDKMFSFVSWFDKARKITNSNAEYTVEVSDDTQALYNFLQENEIKINQKMATSLYAGMLEQFQAFRSAECDGMVFATVAQLIALKAEYKKCTAHLLYSQPLSFLRLKSLLLGMLTLKEEGSIAELFVSDKQLQESGAKLKDAYSLMDEALKLVHVKEVRLIKSDENSKILKILKEKF